MVCCAVCNWAGDKAALLGPSSNSVCCLRKMNQPQRTIQSLAFVLGFTAVSAFGFTFTSNTTIGAGDLTYEGQDIVVSNCTLTVNGPHNFASLVLTDSAVLTHSASPNGEAAN